ncbi:valine--tRNA ligase [Candidatus Mycoplasma mahonii]|uniref:valine--tRNA ligase n=1 Tax=Candidatus Mycoplasma mahonii TaxID=3004105 RepID=UPI0026F25A45|nr:valine--tRNA ligase [Candidatus Mycoplasma mahonii]WKX02373.1 valine--tRNA ligase [Candidatus Mycoplasma mahonii]
MNTKYNHKEVEEGKNQKWIDKEFFSTHDKSKPSFSIILPPPNITGKLHLGHAWDGLIQDTIIRYKKLNGFDVMWVPGMDHAGIATQAKVEAKLRDENKPGRFEMGREKFIDEIWKWKDEYALTIKKQWGKLGLALDYKKERFTMDKGLSEAVSKVFIKMYQDKLIYRGTKAINWDPTLQTVLSNIEVINKDTESEMVYINYPIENSNEFIVVATTRAETMFSDVAIAVHPGDKKMHKYVGMNIIHPLTSKILPIITDEYIKCDKGSGAMKVSAHATTDIDIIIKNNLEVIECIDTHGMMNQEAGELKGFDRFRAREKVINLLENNNLVIKREKIINAVGYSERSGAIVEILVSPQWFVKMDVLRDKILKDLASQTKVAFYPRRYEDVLKTWMEDVHDWTISRQLWWGHRIPAWYKNEDIRVQEISPGNGWIQEEDVLDTWFSSALAPFSFLGWPDDAENVKRYYPTSLLVTGYDIIFFWVARMYFQGLEFMDQKPFNDVLIHGLIRAADGKKMSKSLGNGVDPMDVVEKYGSDSLRWFLLTNSTPGQDIRYSPQKIEAAWNINNKLWNISRYIIEIMSDAESEITDADQWILDKLANVEKLIKPKIDKYDFTIIGKELSKFIMEDFSSWYIEFTKATPNKKIAQDVLNKLLIMLHPFMPNITDHIYSMSNDGELLDQSWPRMNHNCQKSYIDRVIIIITELRKFKVDHEISNKEILGYWPTVKLNDKEIKMIEILANALIQENKDALIKIDEFEIYIKLSDIQKSNESKRIKNRIIVIQNEIIRAEDMLKNERFIAKAPKEKVIEEKKKLNKFKEELLLLRK